MCLFSSMDARINLLNVFVWNIRHYKTRAGEKTGAEGDNGHDYEVENRIQMLGWGGDESTKRKKTAIKRRTAVMDEQRETNKTEEEG